MPMAFWRKAAAVGVILFPALLLFDPQASFTYDWHNHQWLIGYFGEFIHQHHAAPEVLNSATAVGMVQPVFYGFTFFPLIGILAGFVGAAWALRLAVVAALAIEFLAVYRAARDTAGDRRLSFAFAAVAVWSIYGLTNLYNRSAITEFFAVVFFTSAVAFALSAVWGPERPSRAWFAGTAFCLATATHPPTAMLGGALVLLLWLAFAGETRRLWRERRSTIYAFVVVAVLIAVVMAPWVYANLRFGTQLEIVGRTRSLTLAVDRSDSWAARFAPFPYDRRSTQPGDVDLPYIEAPVDAGLLLLLVFNLGLLWAARGASAANKRGAGSIAAVSLLWFGAMIVISTTSFGASAAQQLGPYVQFCMRFVSHANVALLIAGLATALLVSTRGLYRRRPVATVAVAAAALTLGFIGAALKLTHGAAVLTEDAESQYAWRGDRSLLVSCPRADAASDYAADRFKAQLAPAVVATASRANVPVIDRGAGFGDSQPLEIEVDSPRWIVSNIVVFPWNRLVVDGAAIPEDKIFVHAGFAAIKLPPGRHRISYEWHPDALWRMFSAGSRFAFALLLVGVGVGLGLEWRSLLRHRPTG
jgi:hypothetical protein